MHWEKTSLVYISLLLAASVVLAASNLTQWYVTPNTTSGSCEYSPCNTLHEIGAMQDDVFMSFTSVVFLPGTHELSLDSLPDPTSPFLQIRDITNFSFIGISDFVPGDFIGSTEPSTRIVCQNQVGFFFLNVSNLLITNLTVVNCGANITDKHAAEAFVLYSRAFHIPGAGQKAAFFLASIRSLFVSSCVVQNSSGYGLLAVNALDDTVIFSSVFINNNQYTVFEDACQRPVLASEITNCHGGNVLFLFADLLECPNEVETQSLIIQNSAFALGVSLFGGGLRADTISRGTGLGVILAQSSYGVLVLLDNVLSYGNRALLGANFYFAFYEAVDNSRVIIQNSRSMYGNNIQTNSASYRLISPGTSGGLHVDYGLPILFDLPQPVCGYRVKTSQDVFQVINSDFQFNNALTGAGVYFHVQVTFESTPDFALRFFMDSVNISNNVGTGGIALYISELKSFDIRLRVQFIFQNLTIEGNRYILPIRNLTDVVLENLYSAVQLVACENVTIFNSNFFQNEGTALSAFESNLQMSGVVNFTGNSGVDGGALALQSSYVYLLPQVVLYFVENYALHRGGAVIIEGRNNLVNPCYFQVLDPTIDQFPRVLIYFKGNYAEESGSALYGGTIDQCTQVARSVYAGLPSLDVFNAITSFGDHDNSSSLISSEPSYVCLCNETAEVCTQSFRVFRIVIHPGEDFKVPVITRGQRNGISPSNVQAVFSNPFTNSTLEAFQHLQEVGKTCTNLTYTIRTSNDFETVLLRTGDYSSNTSLVIDFTRLPCPLGFVLLDGSCQCDPQLIQYNITCDLNTHSIRRPADSWVNASFDETGQYIGVIVHYNCPNEFCLSIASDLNLSEPNTQCTLNHAGVLCGGCRKGYSVTLGSFDCIQCSNNYLALITVFLVVGLALVAFIFIFNFTFTVGTLSGIIFYANIIRANQSLFFPSGTYSVISVFIAWLNLDPGYHFCLYDGMDSFAKIWLNYCFPFYIFLIIGGLIIISRYSTKVSNTLYNSVQVLAMLLVLSYTKLFRDVILTSFSSTAISFPDNKVEAVWTQDGNIEFFKGRHIALFCGALIVLVLVIIPYTLFLLLGPTKCIQARTDRWLLSWLNKFKPCLDAHHGQYKNSYRNWTGILLVVRVALFFLLSLNIKNDPAITLLVITIFMFALTSCAWVGGGIYYKTWQNILEGSFFINLGILSVTMLYVLKVEGDRAIPINVSGSVALIEFVAILTYHSFLQLRKIKRLRGWLERCKVPIKSKAHKSSEIGKDTKELDDISPSLPSTTVVSIFTELREPLLEN